MFKKVAVVGTGQTRYTTTRNEETYQELIFQAAKLALDDAGLTPDDVDAVVLSVAPEALFGIDSVERWLVAASGAINKPIMRINTGGATGGSAAQAGYFHVASGLFDTVLVVGAEKQGDTPNTQLILNKIMDPRYEIPFGLNAISMTAIEAVRHMRLHGTTQEQLALVATRSRSNAFKNPYAHLKANHTVEDVMNSKMLCWPLKLFDCPPRSSGSCAVVMTSEEKAKKIDKPAAWIKGVGATSTTYFIGDKLSGAEFDEHGSWDELALAVKSAYKQAGISDPAKEVDLAEIYAPFTICEVCAKEALGFCEKGQACNLEEKGYWNIDGQLPVNASGGVLSSNPIGITGLARVAEATLQLTGKADERQVDGVKTAVATSIGGTLQFHTVIVLSN
ncbi:MAG: thiolase family protein [Thermodesulfobacteriota bacterium]|nr:thiolase family protein [Thermodesulfobacteriota bacterium]